MTRWKALPGELDPAVVEFVGQLRRLKDESGLSLRRLAARTGYSTSSWDRYLSARLLPPLDAVEALASIVGADSARLLARYEAASDAWRLAQSTGPTQAEAAGPRPAGADASAPGIDAEGVPDPLPPAVAHTAARGGVTYLHLLLTAVVSAATGAVIAVLAMQAGQDISASSPGRQTVTEAPAISYTCNYARRDGLWYAGNSTTRTDPLQVDMSGPDVAELQCLLHRAGISPGAIDGGFGPLTEGAVIKAQKKYGLSIDGQVGPQTWAALRG